MDDFWSFFGQQLSIQNVVLQPEIVIWAPFGRPRSRKDHVDFFLESPSALWALRMESRSILLVKLLWYTCAENTRVCVTTAEITIFLSVVIMCANIFAFGTIFFDFL